MYPLPTVSALGGSNYYRLDPARLVLHVHQSAELVGLLTQVSLSPSLVYLAAHPPALLVHLATEYLTPPPPSSTEEKFWSVFLPIRDRPYESINLIYGPRGEGNGDLMELVVEVLVRASGGVKRRGVTRVLEGWSIARGEPCELASLESLKSLWRKAIDEVPKSICFMVTQGSLFHYRLLLIQHKISHLI